MLTDPEKPFEEWAREVRAATLNEAQIKCEAIAAGIPLTEVLSVSQETVTPYEGTYRFICWFRGEITENGDNND